MTNLYDDITPKPKKITRRKPSPKTVLHVSQIKAKPKPTYKTKKATAKPKATRKRRESFDFLEREGGGPKPGAVRKLPTGTKSGEQYDEIAGPRAPMSKRQLDSLNTWLAGEYDRLGITQNPYKPTSKKNNTKKK